MTNTQLKLLYSTLNLITISDNIYYDVDNNTYYAYCNKICIYKGNDYKQAIYTIEHTILQYIPV